MTAMRALRLAVASALLLSGCGRADDPATPGAAATPPGAPKPAVIVTLDGKTRDCMVALSSEAQGSAVACDDVAAFLRDELRVPSGAVYTLHTSADIDSAQVAKVNARLQGAGYRSLDTPGRP
jgi:ABC-type Fe3+-hydroxamate transport system substrate-binding protein